MIVQVQDMSLGGRSSIFEINFAVKEPEQAVNAQSGELTDEEIA